MPRLRVDRFGNCIQRTPGLYQRRRRNHARVPEQQRLRRRLTAFQYVSASFAPDVGSKKERLADTTADTLADTLAETVAEALWTFHQHRIERA